MRTFENFLPSLDLKRQQLMAERAKAARGLAETRREIDAFRERVGRHLPMLANLDVDLSDLVRITGVQVGIENLVGTRLPVLKNVEIDVRPYALLAKPHWVDNVVQMLRSMLEMRIRLQIQERRMKCLAAAVKTITQRVNLFDKVLIPRTRSNIKRIKIYLSDEEMSAVVRSKIAKKKRVETRPT